MGILAEEIDLMLKSFISEYVFSTSLSNRHNLLYKYNIYFKNGRYSKASWA